MGIGGGTTRHGHLRAHIVVQTRTFAPGSKGRGTWLSFPEVRAAGVEEMADLEEFSSLVGDIYDASLDPALWPAVFEQVCRFVRCSSAHLFAQDSVRKAANAYFGWGDHPDFTRLYVDKYARLNPMFPGAIFFNVEEVHQLIEIIPRSELCRTRFAVEWMGPQQMVDDMFCVVEKSATSCSLFQVIRRRKDGVIDEEAKRCMALIAPHVRRAVLIGKVIDLKKVEAAALADSLDTLTSAMFLVDASGRIVHANKRGHIMVAEGTVLRAVGGRLGAVDRAANHALQDSFAAAEDGDAAVGCKGIAVSLKGHEQERYVANVLPLTSGARRKAGLSYSAVATVFVHKAALDLPSPPEAIAKEFKLTPTELRVLFAIVEVGGVPEVADVLGVSTETVKTHMRSLFDKTGAGRQADLVKLVAAYSNPVLR
jgi:DNA-binding CsgD family transcriptional regulator